MPSDTSHVCRRLIVLLDGTWNEDNDKQPATNIVYLRERLFWGLQTLLRSQEKSNKERPTLPESHKTSGTSGFVFDRFEYIVYYDRGVGTGPFLDRLTGGVTGKGLDHNIRKAYRFLSQWFRPGDEIFVFGFSRGAFTARSLCGYLGAVGLLRAEACTAENETRAWNFYRTAPGDRVSAEWLYFRQSGTPLVYGDNEMRVRALAVFDTVGALGIPGGLFSRSNRAKYEFHDTDVSSLVDIRLHALAIDEPRLSFVSAPWTKPKFKLVDEKKSPTEQVWFAGAHADIGGGYVKWNQHERGLSYLAMTWMLQRLQHHLANTSPLATAQPSDGVSPNRSAPVPFFANDLLRTDSATGGTVMADQVQTLSESLQHKPWPWLKAISFNACRTINQLPQSKRRSKEAVGLVPHSDPIGEMIHVSALARMNSKKPIAVDKGRLLGIVGAALRAVKLSGSRYAPPNLAGAIPFVAATYLRVHKQGVDTPWKQFVADVFSWKEIRVVDWDGRPLDPEVKADAVRAFELLPTPEALKVREMPAEMKLVLRPSNNHAPEMR